MPLGMKTVMELFDVGPRIAITVLLITALLIIAATAYVIHSAPPTTLTISSGPQGSIYYDYAKKYAEILERNGVKLKVLDSNGSYENLSRLNDPGSHVDIAFAQAGIPHIDTRKLISLGSVAYQPLLVFYRGSPLELLSELKGKRVAIGAEGSGTRTFALKLLKANGIDENATDTPLLNWDAGAAAQGLEAGTLDAAFVMSESASTEILHELLHAGDIHLFNFRQATAYSRRIDYLNVLTLPEGAIDFGKDIPPQDVSLLGPMVELVAVKGLHPALSDLLLEAATEVHGHPGIFQHRGEFPMPVHHEIRLSADAIRYFKSGKDIWFRYLPFWLASLTRRIVLVFFPLLVVLIPAIKSIPAFYRWRVESRIHRHYRELLGLERDFLARSGPDEMEKLRDRFDTIEESANQLKIPASFADQFYGLKTHIDYVRQLVSRRQA